MTVAVVKLRVAAVKRLHVLYQRAVLILFLSWDH